MKSMRRTLAVLTAGIAVATAALFLLRVVRSPASTTLVVARANATSGIVGMEGLAADVDEMCLGLIERAMFRRGAERIARKLERGGTSAAVRDLGRLIHRSSRRMPDNHHVVVEATRVLQTLLVGEPQNPSPVVNLDDTVEGVVEMAADLSVRQRDQARLVELLASAQDAIRAGRREEYVGELGAVVRHVSRWVARGDPGITPEQASGIISEVTGAMTEFDPEPLIVGFRDAVKAGEFDSAVDFVVATQRADFVARLDALTVAEQETIESRITTNIEGGAVEGEARQYEMTADDGTQFPIIFLTDCDGSWRIGEL